ncbi:MAG: hypothetical protein IJY96_07985 [Oscillospiraceae bacterium]|nr:hypothetical protein [Oscillospiraceae bacterium]
MTDSSADINWADVAYSGLLGGLTGLAMGGDVETERGNTSSVTAEAATPSPQGEGSGAIPQSPDGNSSLYTREPSEVPPLPKVENAEGVDAQAAETNLAKFSSFNEYWGDLQRRKKAAEFAYDYAEGESVFAASERLKAVEAEERAAINMRSAAQVTPMAEDAETDSITEVPPLPSIESVRQQAVEEERQRAIEKVRGIAEKLGVKVEARSLGEGHHGEYSNGVITINSNSENPVREVFVHELTHHLETSGHYDRLKDMVLRHVVTDMKADVESLKSSIISEYAEGGIELDDAGATRELVAKFCESRLFTDEASIERLARTDRNLFQRVYDWIRDTVAKVGADREARFLIDAQRMYEKALRGADASAGDGHVSYSIGVIDGKNASYGKGVLLDTNLFDRVKPRNWGKVLSEFVYKNLAGKELTMYDADGNAETVHVAKTNDRVTKDGAKNSHKVIDKLARNGGDNVKALATVHLSELLEASGNEITTNEHNHQWMDENGWSYRTVYLQDRSGNIYEAMLNIANGRDRRIIYAINNIRQIDIKKAATDGVVPSTENGRGSHINSGYPDTITEEKPVVKQDSYGTSFDDLVSRSGANTEYEGTEATERLGIKIASPITGLKGAEDLVARQKAAYKNRKLLTKKIKELQPTADEREFAIGLAKGIYSEDSAVVRFGPKLEAMNMDKVRELADYYRANEGFDVDMLSYKRRENTRNEEAIAEKLLSNSDAYHSTGTFSLNFNTMKRNIRRIFGKDAAAINARYFDPVTKNSAERIRFINRMYDRVRKFDLSKSESELVQLVIEGTAVQDQVSKMAPDIREKVMDAAQSTDVAESARDMGLSTEQRKAAEAYSKWLQTQARLEDADVDAEKVDAAAKAYSEAYDDFYAATNDFLVAHGYEPIGYIKGYAPHMQPDQVQTGVAGFLKRMGLDASVTELPTEIAGRTADFKPGKQWNPYFQHRNGTDTQVDAVAGFESYVEYMSNVFYHTDDIQKLRVLSNTLRTKYSDEEISNRISYAKGLYNAPKEVKLDYLIENNRVAPDAVLSEEQVNEKLEEYVSALYDNVKNLSRFGPLVTAIDDYTNKLAGKQTKLDRAIEEGLIGRKALNWGNVLSKRFGESTIVGNLSSALNQMAQLPMVQAELGNKYMLWAIKDMLSGEAGALDHESDFLTGKMGIEGLTEKRKWSDKNSKEKHAKVMDVAAIPFTAVDNLASRLIVRAAYLKSVNEGLSHEKAVAKADDFAEKVVGSRMQGARPMVFESKNIFTKLFTTFQLEVANTWAHISRDLNDDIRHTAETDGKKAAIEKTAKMLSSYTVEAFLMNRLCEALYGGTPAPLDLLGYVVGSVAKGFGESTNAFLVNSILRALGLEDEDEEREFDAEAALTEAGSLVVGDLPYVRNAASMMGYGDSSLPIPELPTDTAKSLWGNIMAMLKGEETDWGDTLNDALNEVTDWLPMGNQIRKTIQGGITVGKGGRYAGDELMYPVDTSGFGGKLTAAKALLFGNSALGAADEYYAADARRLSAKQTETYEQLVGAGEDMDTVYDTIMKVRGVENVADSDADGKEKRDIIRSSDMSDLSKAALFSTLIGDGNDDKFAALMDAGMSWDDCMDIYERHRELGDDESMKKTEMATEFAHWVDDNYDAESAALIKEQFKFWNMMSAEASNYEKFTGAGLSSEASELLADSFGALEPEKGAESVSNIQKYRAIADSDLSDEEKNAALGVVMSEGQLEAWHSVSGKLELDEYIDGLEIAANTTGDKDAEGHTIDYSEKFNVMMAVDKLDMNDSDKEVLFSALGYKSEENIWNTEYEGDDYKTYYYMSDGAKADYNSWCSWMEVSEFEEHYAHMSELSADKDSNGNTINGSLQRKRIEYIDGLDLRADEKCALYRCFYSAKSSLEKCIWYNPYDPTVNWSSKFPTDWT